MRQTTVTTEQLPAGIAGTRRTLDVMAAAVRGELKPDYVGYRSESIRQFADQVCSGVQRHEDELEALLFFVRDRVRYRLDPVHVERVQDPTQTLHVGSGDCDDKCVLLAALCASLGHVPRFVVQAQQHMQFDHVYCEIWLPAPVADWIAADPTADGLAGRPLGGLNWRHPAPIEWVYTIFVE